MTAQPRQVIPPGPADDPIAHIYPIIDFLEAHGLPLDTRDTSADADPDRARGFLTYPSGKECVLDAIITAEVWAQVQENFDLPPTIVYTTKHNHYGVISDQINQVEIHGCEPRKVARLDEVAPDGRLIIPAGTFDDAVEHLYPIAQFLRDEAGLRLTWEDPEASPGTADHLGFVGQPDGWRCFLGGPITPEIWAALNERFVLPRNLVYWPADITSTGGGMIRDNDNWVDIIGQAVRPGEERT